MSIRFFIISMIVLFAACVVPKQTAKLSRPEKFWALGHPFSIGKAKKATKSALTATDVVKNQKLLFGNGDGDCIDAFRHAYWMALLAQRMPAERALKLGRAHERGNYIDFKSGRLENGYLPDSLSSVMDLLNNEFGVAIGKRNKTLSADSLQTKIMDEVKKGNLWMLKKDRYGGFVDCNGIPLIPDYYKGKWSWPKCLVKTTICAPK